MHDNSNTDNINIYEDGLYRITYHVDSNDSGVTHELHSQVRVNDTSTLNGSLLVNRDYQNEHIPSSASFLTQLNAGDFITLQAQRITANLVVNETTVTVVKLETGARGAKGDKGEKGDQGDKGDPGTVQDGTDYDIFKIDQDNTNNLQTLSFGSGTTSTFTYNQSTNQFEINDDLTVN